MSRTYRVAVLLLGGACVGEPGDRPASADAASDRLRVVAVNYPLAYMAERIGGESVTVDLPVPGGIDPAFWQPTPGDIGRIQAADVILQNGAGYAKWTATATLPQSKMVVTSQTVADRYITIDGSVSHTHGPEGEHSHGEAAFTTWLDQTMATAQAEVIAGVFGRLRPDAAATFDANLAGLVGDLETIDAELANVFERFPSRRFIGSHPVYQYLARRYDLQLAAVHFEPDQVPSVQAWRDLERLHARSGASVMLWEAEPLPETRERLEALGLKVVVFAPAGKRPDRGDYLGVMGENVTNLDRALAID